MNGDESTEDTTETIAGHDTRDTGGGAAAFRLARILVAVTTILGVVAIATVGMRTQVLDTDEWVNLSTELLDDPEVQEAVATYLVEVVYTEVDVPGGLADALPENLEGLASPLAGVLRGPLTDSVERLLDSSQFQDAWESANRTAHQALVNILRDETREGISTADGTVALELNGLVLAVGESLGLSESTLDQLPEDAGRIVIFESDELDAVQQVVKILDFLAWFVFALVILLYALSVYIARGRRMRVLRSVGWSVLVVGVVVLAARALAIQTLTNAIVDDPAGRASAENAASIATALLRQMGWSAVFYGGLIVLFTALMGDRAWATSVRRTLAPAFNASRGAVIGGTAVGLLLFIWWSPGRAFDGWLTGLTMTGLVIGGVATLRTRTQREYPDITTEEVISSLTPGRRSAKE